MGIETVFGAEGVLSLTVTVVGADATVTPMILRIATALSALERSAVAIDPGPVVML
jgi:hypothetical protein